MVGSRGKVISIEASPPIFFCLSKFCKYNDLKNVTLINAAICEKEQEVIVGGSGEASRISNSGNGFKVKGTTLDLIVKSLGIDMIDFIYMNIEGAEKMAIQGMTDCIKKTKNICISCHDFLANSTGGEHYRSKNDVLEFLKKNNFRIITNENHEAASIRDILYGVNQEL